MRVLWLGVWFALAATGASTASIAGQVVSAESAETAATDEVASELQELQEREAFQGCSSCTLRHRSMTKRYEELKAAEEARGDCQIKGEIRPDGARVYYLPGEPGYGWAWVREDKGERWFCSAGEAEAAGWEPSE
jgi:hypothetical protein